MYFSFETAVGVHWIPDNQNTLVSKKFANTASKMKAISNVGERIQRIQYSYIEMFARKDALPLTNETATVQIDQLQKQNRNMILYMMRKLMTKA